ncbi:MAG: hypothetical protein KF850_26960 [Labilithrix sp.]|nr:hypothetical protein [Labilithrix sp.]MBX3215708.1 hypothetical protein [Labilithrix sp.]
MLLRLEEAFAHAVRGARPRAIGITWRLEHPIAGALFAELATLAQG